MLLLLLLLLLLMLMMMMSGWMRPPTPDAETWCVLVVHMCPLYMLCPPYFHTPWGFGHRKFGTASSSSGSQQFSSQQSPAPRGVTHKDERGEGSFCFVARNAQKFEFEIRN
ncbi:hypothetical protein BZA05DRAFT_422196 [Tricharina praecox]|uniref:uncharacterized protein n=1 Tax=Tricharina praecox TaxID=43433 RepID=UPI0022203BD0|nr:uncharacterized protein BZA05DRAFT_422196 [Tricharina praecox]KAI5843249.1 hypothetical protein BZA05DRAFT_422196 [Tricharina praecox]